MRGPNVHCHSFWMVAWKNKKEMQRGWNSAAEGYLFSALECNHRETISTKKALFLSSTHFDLSSCSPLPCSLSSTLSHQHSSRPLELARRVSSVTLFLEPGNKTCICFLNLINNKKCPTLVLISILKHFLVHWLKVYTCRNQYRHDGKSLHYIKWYSGTLFDDVHEYGKFVLSSTGWMEQMLCFHIKRDIFAPVP